MQLLNTLLLLSAVTFNAQAGTDVGVETPTTPVEPETGETLPIEPETEEDSKITLEDEDKNGIPDVIEKYYNDHIRDQYLFGISLGALISMGITFVFEIVKRVKDGKFHKIVNSTNNKTEEAIENLEKNDAERLETFKAYEVKVNDSLIQYKQITDECLEKLNKATIMLNQYATIESKIDACLSAIRELSKSEEFIAQGITEQVENIFKEVE